MTRKMKVGLDWLRDDERPHRYGWAPGHYMCRCRNEACGKTFSGDKRAQECADCAYAKPWPPVPREAFDPINAMLDAYNTVWEAEKNIDTTNVERVRRNAMTAAFWAAVNKRP